MVGYGKSKGTEAVVTSGNEAVKLYPVLLRQATTTLKEMVVEGQKLLIGQHMDKTVMDVQNSIVSAGSTALEVLPIPLSLLRRIGLSTSPGGSGVLSV